MMSMAPESVELREQATRARIVRAAQALFHRYGYQKTTVADIARDLVRHGVEVWISNHRSVAGILAYVRRLGALVGAAARADDYARGLERHVEEVGRAARQLARRPRVWFEEWDDPLISGIEWVAELVRIAGGDDVFPELAAARLAKDRIVADPA